MNNANENAPQLESVPEFNRGKRVAVLSSLALIGAVLWPIQQNWRQDPHDSFPLSYYPMFSTKRDPIEIFYYMVGTDAQGNRHYIPYKMIGTGGGNQVRRQLRKIMNEGRAPDLAKAVAKRLARRDDSPWSEIVSVAVIKGKFGVDDFFHGKKSPVAEQIKGTCAVNRKTHERTVTGG